MRTAPLLIAGSLWMVTATAASAQSVTPPWAGAVDSLVVAEMSRMNVPGAQIAVVQDGRVTYTRGYGVADVESGRPVTEHTLFQLGSVTKLFTATLLAQLASEGRLDLQAPISRYVTDLSGRRVGEVTAQQLIVQTAGLMDRFQPFGRTDDAALGEHFAALGDTVVILEPGRIFSYSNLGFSLAGYVAERATGTPFAALMDSVLLRKLGLGRATFRIQHAVTHDFSQGHGALATGAVGVLRPVPGNSAEWPAGFLYATAAEIARVAIALMGNGVLDGERVLAPDAERAITTGYIGIPGTLTDRAGYGMHTDTIAGERVWFKDGFEPGYSSQVKMWPDRQLAVVISSNTEQDLPARLLDPIAGVVSGRPAPATRLIPPVERPQTAADRAALLGRYQARSSIEIAEGPSGLELRYPRATAQIRMTGPDRFFVTQPGTTGGERMYLVLRDPGGRVLYLHSGGRVIPKLP
jgi:CubicO group peptidase (beta-lactamase class C family)